MIQLAVLDMGGTTIDEHGTVLASFREALETIGVTGSRLDVGVRTVVETMGQSKLEVLKMIAGDDEAGEKANREFEMAMERRIASGEITAMPGALEAMGALKEAGIGIAMTTGFAPATRDLILETLGWSGIPDLVSSPSERLRGRPFPDMVLDAGITRGIDDVRSVAVVGDTISDLMSGHHAGAGMIVGVLTGSHDRQLLESAPHTHIIDSVADLLGILAVDPS